MKKILSLFLILSSICFISNVYAEDKLVTCNYNVVAPNKKSEVFSFTYYDNGNLSKNHGKSELLYDDLYITNYTNNFDKSYSSRIYSGGKVASACPSISVCFEASSNQVVLRNETFFCSDGGNSTNVSGTMSYIKSDTIKDDKKETEYCTKKQTLRNESYTVTVRFFKDVDGKDKFEVKNTSTNESYIALRGGIAGLGNNSFQINTADGNKYYSDKCSSTSMFFKNTGGSLNIIQSNEPVDVENGNQGVNEIDNSQTNNTSDDKTNSNETTGNIGDNFCEEEGVKKTLKMIGAFITLAKLAVPLLIVAIGVIDLTKGVIGGDQNKVSAGVKSLIYRIIIGLLIFFLPIILRAILNGILPEEYEKCSNCLFYATNDCNPK